MRTLNQQEGWVFSMRSCGQKSVWSFRRLWPLFLLVFPGALCRAGSEVSDAQLKAAFVFNFLKFTEWLRPLENNAVDLCVSHADRALELAFMGINGRMASGRGIRVHILKPQDDMRACEVLYVRHGGWPLDLKLLSSSQPDLLTVGDAEDFIHEGGVIGLIERAGQLRFVINLDVARRSRYVFSSNLLKLAYPVPAEKR